VEDETPLRRGPDPHLGTASLLAGESLERYSQDELAARIELLEAEIIRVREHGARADAHRRAADAFFKPPAGQSAGS
jgi:uncharacterized small protein (DUF1192 family)